MLINILYEDKGLSLSIGVRVVKMISTENDSFVCILGILSKYDESLTLPPK